MIRIHKLNMKSRSLTVLKEAFRNWFRKYDADECNRQIEEDVQTEGLISSQKKLLRHTKQAGQKKF